VFTPRPFATQQRLGQSDLDTSGGHAYVLPAKIKVEIGHSVHDNRRTPCEFLF
jgi:hypothetical protein